LIEVKESSRETIVKKDEIMDHLTLKLETNEIFPIGEYDQLFKLVWNDDNLPASEIPVKIQMIHPVVFSLNRIFLGMLKPNEEKNLEISFDSDLKLEKDDLTISENSESIALEMDLTKKICTIKAKAPEKSGRFENSFVVNFRDKTLPPITIHVAGIVSND
jgi:DNA-directed RNA polymerase alpha subunit